MSAPAHPIRACSGVGGDPGRDIAGNIERDFVSQFADFIRLHVPPEHLPRADLTAAGLALAGVLLSTLGAKLARPAVTLVFGGLGVLAAATFGQQLDLPPVALYVIAVVLFAVVGFAAFRLWVGLGTAALLAAIAVGAYGSQRVLPYWADFSETYPSVSSVSPEYVIPDEPIADRSPWEGVAQTSRDFWAHVTAEQTDVERNTLLIAAVAGIFGLVLGSIAVRFTLVVFTALLGTGLLISGLGLGLHALSPGATATLPDHPNVVTGAALSFLVASLILQTLLTRRPPKPGPAPAKTK
jgi:hypothetical protein